MTPAEHHAEAEALLDGLGPDATENALRIAHAQVHATLAMCPDLDAFAKREREAAVLPIRRFVEARAITARALGAEHRDWLDLLILCDRAAERAEGGGQG